MTGKLDPRTQSLASSAPPADGRSYVLVLEGASSSLLHLPTQGKVVIGRFAEAGLVLQHASVSRRHAQLTVADAAILVEDLGSHNGTRVNGVALAPGAQRTLATGDVVSVGDITLVVYRQERPLRRRELMEVGRLLRRVEEEIERGLAYHRPFVLAALPREVGADARLAAQSLDGALRLIDVAGLGDGLLLLLLPELDAAAAAALVDRALAALGGAASAGVAAFPDDGCTVETLLGAARAALEQARPGEAAVAARVATRLELGDRSIIVADPAMVRLYELLQRLAASDLPVLIQGETGVGKENAAFAVHHQSARRDGPFVTLNSAALQETLVESELFGHEKGAFSGATTTKVGLLEAASGGTIFFDEVGELPVAAQAKLLRALESRHITRVGAVVEREIDIRIVAATNRDLDREASEGRFRRDLFFRLGAATVILPPLRQRPREVMVLARAFLEAACQRAQRGPMAIAPDTMRLMARHHWPGNVRELRNLMDYAAAAVLGPELLPVHLPERITGGPVRPASAAAKVAPVGDATRGFRPVADELLELERSRMVEALAASGNVQRRAAELLGMPLRTFAMRMKQYGISSK